MTANEYAPFRSEIRDVVKHTEIEYTFRMAWHGSVKPGQFFEVSIPKYGEAPISVSCIGDDTVDLTIRRVGRVTDEVFEHTKGDRLFLRGPYGNGFDLESMKGREIVVVAGGTGLSPVKGVLDHFCGRIGETRGTALTAGFKSPADILFLEDFARWKKNIDVTLTVDYMGEEAFKGCQPNPACQVGLVTQHIGKLALRDRTGTLAIVLGPPAMMKFSVQGLLDFGLREENILVSYERKMCCGVGKCGHCRISDTYVCTDGPVFRWTEAKFLRDQEARTVDVNTKQLKKNAFRVTKVRGQTASRIRIPGGHLDAATLGLLQKIALEYGDGTLHITSRQGFEIPGIDFADMPAVNELPQPIIEGLGINQERPGGGYSASGTRNVTRPASATASAPTPATTRPPLRNVSKKPCSPTTCTSRSPSPAAPTTARRFACTTSASWV